MTNGFARRIGKPKLFPHTFSPPPSQRERTKVRGLAPSLRTLSRELAHERPSPSPFEGEATRMRRAGHSIHWIQPN